MNDTKRDLLRTIDAAIDNSLYIERKYIQYSDNHLVVEYKDGRRFIIEIHEVDSNNEIIED